MFDNLTLWEGGSPVNVEIRYKGFDKKESVGLKRFLGVGFHFSKRWGCKVYFDTARQTSIVQVSSAKKDDSVYVHFFSSPADDSSSSPKEKKNQHPKKILSSFSLGGGVSTLPSTNLGVLINSGNRTLVQIIDRDIYILFDLCDKSLVQAEQILWEIMEAVAPFVVKHDMIFSLKRSLECLCAGRVRIERDKHRLFDKFKRISIFPVRTELLGAFSEEVGLRKEISSLEKELGLVETRFAWLEEMLNNPVISEYEHGKILREEFDLLHGYESVWGIEIDEHKHNGMMCIYTRPIIHIDKDGNARPLAQYKIFLYPALFSDRRGNMRPGIQICEGTWTGPFKHADASICRKISPDSPCFGQSFVSSIDKAMYDHDFKVLITLVLHFLSSDSRIPEPREPSQMSTEEYSEKNFYASEPEKEKTKNAYVQFSRAHRGKNLKENLTEEHSFAKSEKQRIPEEYRLKRDSWLLERHKIEFLDLYLKDLEKEVPKKFEKLINHPALMRLVISKDNFVWAVFGPGKGEGQFTHSWFMETLRIMVEMSPIRILVYGKKTHSSAGDFCSYCSEPERDAVYKMVARGQLSEAILELYRLFRGYGMSKNTKPDETMTADIERYLAEKAFCVAFTPEIHAQT